MGTHALKTRGTPMGRYLGDVDPETGDLVLDPATGQPRLVLHWSAAEAAPMIGVSRTEVRRRCRSGEWPCRFVTHGAHQAVYLSAADVAAAIESLRVRPRRDLDDAWHDAHPGIRGVVVDPEDDDEEGAQ